MKKIFQKIFQIILVPFLKTPHFRGFYGFSLIRSQKVKFFEGQNVKYSIPFDFRKTTVGDYTYIGSYANINNTSIGKFCSIGPHFYCGMGIHPLNGISTHPMFYSTSEQNGKTLVTENRFNEYKRTVIGNDVFIGVNVTVLDGVRIGDGAVIGAGAVVTEDIPPYAIAVGVPAKVVKMRFDDITINRLLQLKWWDFDPSEYPNIVNDFFNIDEFLKRY